MRKLLILAFVLFAPLALAQDIANHSMPIGGGPGAVGWKTGGPCTAGQALVWPSTSADPVCSAATPPGWVSPKQYGAVCDGVTNDSSAFALAVAALSSGGVLALPASVCCLSTGVTVSASIRILGGGALASQLSACGANTSVVIMNARRATLEHVAVIGTDSLAAAHPTIDLQSSCVECLIFDVYSSFGSSVITVAGADSLLEQVYAAYAYGTTVINNTSAGAWFIRVKVDQNWPTGTPPTGLASSVPAWASAHAYALNEVVTVGGYILQCNQAGTSGGSPPTVAKYFTNIVDNTARWQLALPSTYYGTLISGTDSQNTMTMMDYTGSFVDAIHVSGAIFSLKVNQSSFGQFLSSAIATTGAGKSLYLSDSEIIGGIYQTIGTAVNIGSTWIGQAKITGNTMIGNFWGRTAFGVVLGGGGNNRVMDNSITGFGDGVLVAANLNSFLITNNMLGSSPNFGTNTTPVVIQAGTSDFYAVTTNIVDGLAISDGGTGVNKTVAGNF